MKKLTIAALLTVSLAGFTYAAMADNHRGTGGAMLEEVDTNLDGNITKDALSAHRAERCLRTSSKPSRWLNGNANKRNARRNALSALMPMAMA